MTGLEIVLAIAYAALAAVVTVRFGLGRRHRARHSPGDAEHQVGTWRCPDCGVDVPVMATVQHVAVVNLDPTDLYAHQLTHEESR